MILTLNFQGQIWILLYRSQHGPIATKRKAISIELRDSNVIIGFDLGHDLDLEFSRSNIEFAIPQPKMVRLPRNEKQNRLSSRPEMWSSGLTLAMIYILNFQGQIWILLYLWKEYQRARNSVNAAITLAKKRYYDNAIDHNKNDPRMIWKKINELIRDKKKNVSCNHGISAYSFNEYFSKVGHTVTSKFVNQDDIKWRNPATIHSFEFVTIDEGSVVTDLLTMNADSNNDVLQLDSKLLRLASPLISNSLTHLFNLSLMSRVIPSD